MDMREKISNRLAELMDYNGQSVSTLACLTGLTPKTIERVLSKKRLPSNAMMKKICMVFGITVSEFFDNIICEYKKQYA